MNGSAPGHNHAALLCIFHATEHSFFIHTAMGSGLAVNHVFVEDPCIENVYFLAITDLAISNHFKGLLAVGIMKTVP